MVGILLCLYKVAIIKSQTLELNHKYWEIPALTSCLAQSCLVLSAMLSELCNCHFWYPAGLRAFSTEWKCAASISQPSEVLHRKPPVFLHALEIDAANSVWWEWPIQLLPLAPMSHQSIRSQKMSATSKPERKLYCFSQWMALTPFLPYKYTLNTLLVA